MVIICQAASVWSGALAPARRYSGVWRLVSLGLRVTHNLVMINDSAGTAGAGIRDAVTHIHQCPPFP